MVHGRFCLFFFSYLSLCYRGLSGCTPEQIQKVSPEFISVAKITQSLTPGRNNGFLNMLAVMKNKASKYIVTTDGMDDDDDDDDGRDDKSLVSSSSQEDEKESSSSSSGDDVTQQDDAIITSFEEKPGKPMYNEMMSSLLKLKPTQLLLEDNSDQHAGHAGSKGWEESGESHFQLTIVADAFEGLSLVKRHQLIYLVLGDTMQKIHALQIHAKAPSEV
jgi:Stress-induced morphogen (activity unknown)